MSQDEVTGRFRVGIEYEMPGRLFLGSFGRDAALDHGPGLPANMYCSGSYKNMEIRSAAFLFPVKWT